MVGPQCVRWCITLNNYIADTDYSEILKKPELNCRRAIIGKEVGSNGTHHLQGYIEFQRSYRISHLQKFFPRGHFEAAKGSAK